MPKPGLMRVAKAAARRSTSRSGGSSADAFGRFVAAIPPPLGIGTVELEDGTAPKGFLVEPAGLTGALDISHYGGWRRYVSGRAHRSSLKPSP